MDEYDQYPTRDSGGFIPHKNKHAHDEAMAKRASQQKHMVTKWSREELEDKYIRMHEENLILKKHARKQEEKIKKMATKLLRLVSDKKKQDAINGAKKGGGRDIETEEMLEELHSKMSALEKQNHQYKEKLSLMKQQLATQNTRKTAYGHVQSRISTGIQKTAPEPHIAKQMRVQGPAPTSSQRPNYPYPRYGQSVLEHERAHSQKLEQIIAELNENINLYEQDIAQMKEQMRMRETEYEEDILKIKQQLSQGQRTAIQENIDSIRLQREVKEKSTKLTQLQGQYAQIEEKLRTVKGSHDQVLMEMEVLNDQLKIEQNRVLSLQNELKSGATAQRAVTEYKERCLDLERECDILKEANEKLVASAFDLEREREWKQRENALKVQVAQLEATLRADVGEKGTILDRLNEEREEYDKMEEELREIRVKFYQTKQENDELRDKIKFFTSESAVDFQEIEEALVMVKQRKERENQQLDFLHQVDDEKNKDYKQLVRELQAEHADTINELEKTRNMLIVQHKINKEYQQEVESVTGKKEELVREYDTKLDEYAALLDIRANRIKKLEAQLRDVAYGTRQYRVTTTDEGAESDAEDDLEETVHLERGENLFEIHVTKVALSAEATQELGDDEPHLFATWEFFEHEVQATPVMKGPRPNFHFTSQYVVKVDDFFLHYLQKDACTLELHQSFGTDYRTIAACQLNMRDILDKPQGRLHDTVPLTGTGGSGVGPGTNYGVLEYWVRLKVPMEQALRLFKERTKALGYMDINKRATAQALQAMDENARDRPPDNVNTVTINLKQCSQVESRREGIQPSSYCVYKFFDFADHVTSTVPGSNSPQFNDTQVYNVPMTADLDKYIKTQPLYVYVFDDTDPDQNTYLGAAHVPLIPLAHNKPVAGVFELYNSDGVQNGTIEVSLKWRFNYLPPTSGTRTAAQMLASGADLGAEMSLLPGEEDALKQSVHASAPGSKPRPPRTPQPIRGSSGSTRPPRGPAAHSTPTPQRHSPRDVTSPRDHVTSQRSASPVVTSQMSVVSEGAPVSGEDDPVSEELSDTQDSTPPSRDARPPPPEMEAEASAPSSGQEEPVTSPHVTTTHQSEGEEAPGDDTLDRSPDQLIAEELGESYEHKGSDTMFGDTRKGEESGSESARSRITHESETESEVVMHSPTSRTDSQLLTLQPSDTVKVCINHLSFEEGAPLYESEAVSKLFVEYRFLDVAPEETETPYALPKPPPNRDINFNFTKVFHVDYENFYQRRQYLAGMLLPDDPLDGKIKLTVVSEPDDEDGECEDVGKSYVSVRDILRTGRDLEDTDIDILDAENEAHVIGKLNVTVKCVDALKAVQAEMDQDSA